MQLEYPATVDNNQLGQPNRSPFYEDILPRRQPDGDENREIELAENMAYAPTIVS